MQPRDYFKAVGVGIANAVALSAIMVPAARAGISPFPEPLSLAFARLVLGQVPMPVGLLFHLVYVTFWSVVYVAAFPRRTFLSALWLAAGLWVIVLVIFFPMVHWGAFGLAVSPKLIVASLVPHLLFAVFLWLLCRWLLPRGRKVEPQQGT